MNKKNKSIDGFAIRRSGKKLGGLTGVSVKKVNPKLKSKPKSPQRRQESASPRSKEIILPASLEDDSNNNVNNYLNEEKDDSYLSRSDINESLNTIDSKHDFDLEPTGKKNRRLKKEAKKLKKKKRTMLRRILRIVIRFVLLVGLAYAGYISFKLVTNSNSIFNGNIFQAFQSEPLKKDENGRSNFLVVGTSEDDPGHDGQDLTDTMIVVSVDQVEKNAYTFSVPRDLYVNYGQSCVAGSSGKINAYFFCANGSIDKSNQKDSLAKTQKLVGEIFGLDIQYGVHVNYTVVKQAVDAVGGVDVDVQGSGGAPGVMDRYFDYQCDYKCYLVKYDNGVHHLNGTQALNLARARGYMPPTYGLARSNFDREINQQKIIIALKDKAVSSGVLTDFNKVMGLIDAFGNNLRTNIQTKEIRTLVDVAIKTKPNKIHMISLLGDYGDEPLVADGTMGDSSVVMPIEGIHKYSNIQQYISRKLSSNPVVRENAPIAVFNGSGVDGLGHTKSSELKDLDFNVTFVDTAPEGDYSTVEIYQIGDESRKTAAKLASIYDITIKTTEPPVSVGEAIQFVIIYGQSESAKTE